MYPDTENGKHSHNQLPRHRTLLMASNITNIHSYSYFCVWIVFLVVKKPNMFILNNLLFCMLTPCPHPKHNHLQSPKKAVLMIAFWGLSKCQHAEKNMLNLFLIVSLLMAERNIWIRETTALCGKRHLFYLNSRR